MYWRDILRTLSAQLRDGSVFDANREARYIFEWATGRPFADWVLNEGAVDASVQATLEDAAARRLAGEPLAYITGHREFYGLDLLTNPSALIPRPETELLVDQVLQGVRMPVARVADIGCGTGAIALALRSKRPQWTIYGVDISEDALQLARANGKRLQLPVVWMDSNLLTKVPRELDVIVANLPYIDRESELISPEILFEPSHALFADDQGLALIRQLVHAAPGWLAPRGQIFLECGWDQGKVVAAMLNAAGFLEVAVTQDYSGIERIVSGRRA